MKLLLILTVSLALLAILATGYLGYLGWQSRNMASPNHAGGNLSPCSPKPNCVCTEYPDDTTHYMPALSMKGDEFTRLDLERRLSEMGYEIEQSKDHYISATFRSRLFGFTDDLELRYDPVTELLHFRSASRVGTSDMGANRQRMESLSRIITEHLTESKPTR